MNRPPRGISVNWYAHHRRSDEIAAVVGADAHFIRARHRLLAVRYAVQARETLRLLRATEPDFVVVMQPPPIALFAVAAWARRRNATVIGDVHSGVFFDPKWRALAPMVLSMLRRLGCAIVPNEELATLAKRKGVTTFVCHGLITPLERIPTAAAGLVDGEFVLVPLTYSRDEPVEAIIGAARLTPEVTWVLTGNAPATVKAQAPANVVLPGHVSRETYRALHLAASGIFALTTQRSTMQSAGYEAVASATPLVTVPFEVLKSYFGDRALYVDNSPEEIAEAARRVLVEQDAWTATMRELRDDVVGRQSKTKDTIRGWLHQHIREGQAAWAN